MQFLWPMIATVLYISFFDNGNVKGSILEMQVSQMLQDLKEHMEFLQNGLAQEKVIRINLGKKIDSMEETWGQNLADLATTIDNIDRHIENRLLAKINASDVTFGTKLEEKISTIEQKFEESIRNTEQSIETKLSAKQNRSEVAFQTKLEKMVNTIEQKIKESIGNTEKDIENRLFAKINGSEVDFDTKLEETVSAIEQKVKESIENSEQLTEIRLIARIKASEEAFKTKLEEQGNSTEQTFKESIGNTEQRIENRLLAKINDGKVAFETKLDQKVSMIEQKFKESIGTFEKLTENKLIARINVTEVKFWIKLQYEVLKIEQMFTQSMGNYVNLTENRLSKLNQTFANLNERVNQWCIKQQELPYCKEGWEEYQGSCYYFEDSNYQSMSWDNAKQFCQDKNSQLLRIDNQLEFQFIQEVLMELHHARLKARIMSQYGYWTGGRIVRNEEHWVWSPRQMRMRYTVWWPEEPNDLRGEEDCVELRSNYNFTMNDIKCRQTNYFVCEKLMGR